ncbi:hypothetical protein B0H14DRAFT_2572941 [Mycena olivaceomarginata]|nr:hypothetical protein B0H14DRAFT_2572941 [Mycena olivaceomarginata]
MSWLPSPLELCLASYSTIKTRGFRRDTLPAQIRRRPGHPWSVVSTFSFARKPDARSFLEWSFVPFQGTQYSDPRGIGSHFPASRTQATQQYMGGSFGQHVSQAFLPGCRVELPEGFEAGDRPLDLAGFVAGGEVRLPPPHPPILPSESELSRFPVDVSLRWRGTRPSGREVSGGSRLLTHRWKGGFDTSEDDSVREDDSAHKDDSTREEGHWPPARRARAATGWFKIKPPRCQRGAGLKPHGLNHKVYIRVYQTFQAALIRHLSPNVVEPIVQSNTNAMLNQFHCGTPDRLSNMQTKYNIECHKIHLLSKWEDPPDLISLNTGLRDCGSGNGKIAYKQLD